MEAHFEVDLVSKETVRPSCPMPPNRRTITLSFLDESFPGIHVPRLLIYTPNEFTETPLDNLNNLKTCLSESLTRFYPLAGRFENEYTVSCNDEGIPFIVTRVNCQLKDFLNSPHMLDVLGKFLPPEDIASLGQRPISTVVPLAFQVNFFACGGLAIGCYSIHKLVDGTSMSNFLNYWAALASGRHENQLVKPDFDTIIQVFPPLRKEKLVKVPNVVAVGGVSDDVTPPQAGFSHDLDIPIKVVAKSFKFNSIVIKKLKVDATSETVPNPTTFEAVAGFVWKHTMDAVLGNNKDPQPVATVLSFGVNLRPRTSPPLPKHSMGNIIADAQARVSYGDGGCSDDKLKEIVREIHVAVQTVIQKLEVLQGQNGGEAHLAERNSAFKDLVKDSICKFKVTSWRNLGLDQVDFGFGRPAKIIPVGVIYPFLRNSMMLVEYSDSHGDGVEAYVYLEDKHMPILEANPQFMCVATAS